MRRAATARLRARRRKSARRYPFGWDTPADRRAYRILTTITPRATALRKARVRTLTEHELDQALRNAAEH